ncbi:MAG TPA: ABC transporter ATP-binding protein [Chitinophagales bacterium]|nr:ABC transporter ATP-binding protein [Chitinophagales bacterium]
MSDIVIKSENVSKLYRLGNVDASNFKDDLGRLWANMLGKEDPAIAQAESNDRTTKGSSDYVWALRDINFEVKKGDVVGIIGRNGAGKSTLLKILSKVTAPTRGQIKVKGRIASLLEVGTGFHPELTGKENMYLNGHILGMTKREIDRKFDEIVDFAGVERYLDTPVKRYSSGMYVRLAFAVAAHLEPEILIIDEVLAVGDAEFQKKCLGKMNDVSQKDGRTILFVSHSMSAVTTICNKGILMEHGRISKTGNVNDVLLKYHEKEETGEFNETTEVGNYGRRRGTGECRFKSIKIKNTAGEETNEFDKYSTVVFELEAICFNHTDRLIAAVAFMSNVSNEVITKTEYFELDKKNFEPNEIAKFTITVNNLILNPGTYPLYFWLGNNLIDPNPFDVVDKATVDIIIKRTAIENPPGFVSLESSLTQFPYK